MQIDFVRNDKYWNATTIRQKYLTLKIIPDLVKSTLPFENNDIDWQEIPPTEVDRFKNDAKLKSQVFPYINPVTRFLVPDTGHPPFDKLEVRKATILLSIDKDRLVNQVGKKVHTVAYAMTAPGVFGYFDDDDNKLKNLQKYDKTAALDALKGTTFEGGRNWPKVTLTYNASDTDIPTGLPGRDRAATEGIDQHGCRRSSHWRRRSGTRAASRSTCSSCSIAGTRTIPTRTTSTTSSVVPQ